MTKNQLSTEPYKGTRDFYPEDLAMQKYIFNKIRRTIESFGYEEYNTPTIEPTELYKAKSGDEIVDKQTYSFTDRGGREVTLRPEMTPSGARLVAKKKRELSYPLRWYSIQNFFRYERPQKGRLREFWQLNADIFGVDNLEAETEIILLGYKIMQSLGAKDGDFKISISYANLLERIYRENKALNLDGDEIKKVLRILDLKTKISEEKYQKRWIEALGETKGMQVLKKENEIIEKAQASPEFQKCIALSKKLKTKGIETQLDPQLLRGFDYYTGIVFEFFDTNPDNKRSLFGGGRYDDLLDLFGSEKIPAVGFGMGDVTVKDFLETRNLLPKYQSTTQLFICPLSPDYFEDAKQLADKLRQAKINVAINYLGKKIGEQIAVADKKKIPFIICIGENELKNKQYKLKNLQTGEEKLVKENKLVKYLKLK